MDSPLIKAEFVIENFEDGEMFDAVEFFKEATLEEVLAIDAHGWSSVFERSIPIPLLDVLYFFEGKVGFNRLRDLLYSVVPFVPLDRCIPFLSIPDQDETCLGPNKVALRRAILRIDGHAAVQWLSVNRPVFMERFLSHRPLGQKT